MDTHNIPEIWGGIECSYTRIKDVYSDQLDYCGHYRRGIYDIEAIAQVGFKALRYPIIWERYKPGLVDEISWSWVERQLNALRHYNITPIAGLVHHGSGPIHACLMDSHFATEIEKYAGEVAQKFPWLDFYTPINEPLTTARFCGLYGYWHPHKKNAKAFAEILLNEIKATVLSMRMIRKINPNAKLIQTEDLGKIYSKPLINYQAEFENERRWLSFDLLCGRVVSGHPMWDYLRWVGIPEKLLAFFVEHTCPPDIIGLDYYATSERFLDDDLSKYPPHTHGSNDKHRYADVEAIRVRLDEPHGPKVLLNECWDRYNIPIAITEVHIHGTPEDQIRWFYSIWKACMELKQRNVDVRAVTAWAMFGSFGWSKLLMDNRGEYERGVFDIQDGYPAPTDYTNFLWNLARNPNATHAALEEKGWWETEQRFLFQEDVQLR